MKRSYLEKLYFKSRTENSLKTDKRQKISVGYTITVADFLKKKEKNSSTTSTHLLLNTYKITETELRYHSNYITGTL